VSSRYDAVVVGGGHNGLVAAAYLARAGRSVLVLERRAHPGGAAVSERSFRGHDARLSRYAYLVSLFPPRIADELGIALPLRTRAVAAYADGLLVDAEAGSPRTRASFAALGAERDHEAWLDFYGALADVSGWLFDSLTEPLPSRDHARALCGDAWSLLAERPLGESLRERFEHPLVRGVIATDGLIGTFASLDDASLAQNRCFLWHVIGGPWRVPVGGMGALTDALAAAARSAGAEIRTEAEVLHVDGGDVTFRDAAGAERTVTGRHVLANVAPAELARLRGTPPVRTAEGCQTKVNLLLDRLPATKGTDPLLAFAGTFRLDERDDQLEAAYAESAAGTIPERPPAEIYCHTLTDPSITSDGRHTLTLFGLHTPAGLFKADERGTKQVLLDRYLQALDERLDEPIAGCLARDADGRPCIEVKSPLDLERELRLPAGNIFHGELDWPWTDDDSDRWGVRTDDPRIVVCGAGARRGGGVSGVAGHNAAMHVLGR
jgi:phytoene dehydrogenase-like protein